MIGSHNTFTYLPPKNPIYSLFKALWKCQDLAIEEQYKFGVRFFDIRLIWSKRRNRWEIGHGLVIVKGIYFKTCMEIGEYMSSKFPEAKYRLVLERDSGLERFIDETNELLQTDGDKLIAVIRKKPVWEVLSRSLKYSKTVKDYCVRLFNWNVNEGFWKNIKENFKISYTVKRWAKGHNPDINGKMIDNEDTLYFMDYVGSKEI